MNHMVLASFMDEITKIAQNMAAPAGIKSGMGSNVMAAPTPSVGIPPQSTNPASKPTNFSIVNSEVPSAAEGGAGVTKSAPPPPVRT